jgi:hypothetical protein
MDHPKTLDEAVSWDEELMWSGGARTAYLGIITGEIAPDQLPFYQRWVQRVHDLGYKAGVGWNCAEVFTSDYTYTHRPQLVAKGLDGKDVSSPGLGFRGVMLDWLSTDWQKWASETAGQLLHAAGFDCIYLDWTPADEVHYHYLLAPVDGTLCDPRRKASLSTGNPWYFSWLAKEAPGRIFRFGDTEARDFGAYTGAPVGHGFFSWNRVMTESAGWAGSDSASKAMSFERWCQMAAMRMAYVGAPSLWADPGVTGVSCYLGQQGMKVLRTYSDIVARLDKECTGLSMDLPATATNGASPHVRMLLPKGWARGRAYVLIASDTDTDVTVDLPLISGRYMVCDIASGSIFSTQGPLKVSVNHKDNVLYPAGGLRPLLVQQLR